MIKSIAVDTTSSPEVLQALYCLEIAQFIARYNFPAIAEGGDTLPNQPRTRLTLFLRFSQYHQIQLTGYYRRISL
jgi:hypothetical protein